ncbi:MAG: MaoC family dehydratase N-terminal domain-containing protein [Mycobacterium sp.]
MTAAAPVEFGEVVVTPTTEQLLRWAAAAEDYSPIHFDRDVAMARGFDEPVVHGPWKAAVLRRLLAAWLGPNAAVHDFAVRYLRPDAVGKPLRFGGRLLHETDGSDGARELRCAVWVRDADGTVTVDGECIATHTPDADGTLPMDRLRAAIRLGEDAGSFTYCVESNDVEAFATAIGAMPGTDAPTTYFAALDPVERRDLDLDAFLHRLPFPMTGGGNAFNEVTYERPIRVGDVITVTTRYTEAYEKRGSRGTLLFRVRTNEMRDDTGALVATSRCGHVLSFDLEGSGGAR